MKRLGTSREEYAKYVIKPNFQDWCLFCEELFNVEMGRTEIKINEPVYLGQARR